MAALVKSMLVSKTVNNVAKLLTNLSLSSHNSANPSSLCRVSRIANFPVAAFHATAKRYDLTEFFDDKKNFGENEVKTGRSWKKDELRIKSNEDLHKLWYVLLKERNMLLTMEEACKTEMELFPSPERIDKIQDSMENLEWVVRERNRAYHLLETGELGERPKNRVYSQLGLKFNYRLRQYPVPLFMNRTWHANHKFGFGGAAVSKFRKLYNEKLWNKKRKALNRERSNVKWILTKFPNVDHEAIKAQFPNVDIAKMLKKGEIRGHYIPK